MANAATTSGALKQLIEGLGLGLSAYRDRAPEGQKTPYVVILEGMPVVPEKLVDGGSLTTQTAVETVQVDLWQDWRTVDGKAAELATLAPALARALHGAALALSPTRSYAVLVRSSLRLVEWDANLVHHAITLEIPRAL